MTESELQRNNGAANNNELARIRDRFRHNSIARSETFPSIEQRDIDGLLQIIDSMAGVLRYYGDGEHHVPVYDDHNEITSTVMEDAGAKARAELDKWG